MSQKKLPHNSRLFSADFVSVMSWSVLWILLLLAFFYNGVYRFKVMPLDNFRLNAIMNPLSVSAHLNLTRLYYINGYTDDAKREMSLLANTESSSPDTKYNVLGASAVNQNLLSVWQQQSLSQLSDYQYWKSVSTDKPDYITAKLAAASYAAMLGKNSEAKILADQALKMDPTNQEIISLLNQIKDN